MRKLFCLLLTSAAILFSTARADILPDVENVRVEGNVLSWDAQEGATGYNIRKDYSYFDTVRNKTTYIMNEAGTYRVIAFNDMGDFSDDYGTPIEFSPEEVDSSVSYNAGNFSLVAIKTCKDVGPGESCIVQCPYRYVTEYNSTKYTAYVSGGACSTSDIVEADAFVGPNTYKCTVPTFSGEVVAQAVCPFYNY